jgi:poly-gamma-glutamate capsule biosynthesis protein CapA/YwtB (metallophosphatase superfamily)
MQVVFGGDVMLGRALNVLMQQHPTDDDVFYFKLAEKKNGEIDIPVAPDYVWGDAKAVFADKRVELCFVNLECPLSSELPSVAEKKGLPEEIYYTASPENVSILKSLGVQTVVSLANNHVLDSNRVGLTETLSTLSRFEIGCCGAGNNSVEAREPEVVVSTAGRILCFSCCFEDSWVLPSWKAGVDSPGVNLLTPSNEDEFVDFVAHNKRASDFLIISIHCGKNWGYEVPSSHEEFAKKLVNKTGCNLIFCHSSHHLKPFTYFEKCLIMFGVGDVINDYEGINPGPDKSIYRHQLTYLHRVVFSDNQSPPSLEIFPFQVRQLQLKSCNQDDFEFCFKLASSWHPRLEKLRNSFFFQPQ